MSHVDNDHTVCNSYILPRCAAPDTYKVLIDYRGRSPG